jgi:3-deoxy-manno-octulosonate cytidylyltransferase (CMP-KDO synthetase)
MIENQNTIVVIPARMASTRLPGKPLADILGLPMIVHCWKRAMEANVGQVLVAAAEVEIADVVKSHGGDAIVTNPALPSGSDRIAEALSLRDPQAPLPLRGEPPGRSAHDRHPLDPALPCWPRQRPSRHLHHRRAIDREEDVDNPNIVKAIAPLER